MIETNCYLQYYQKSGRSENKAQRLFDVSKYFGLFVS